MGNNISGSKINFKVRPNGSGGAFKDVICTVDSQFNITNETNVRKTNCGNKTSVADVEFNASGNAVYDYEPDSTQMSWEEVKAYQKAKTKLDFQYYNKEDTANSASESEAVSCIGSGYFTETTFQGSAEDGSFGEFSWTFTGTGNLDSYDA